MKMQICYKKKKFIVHVLLHYKFMCKFVFCYVWCFQSKTRAEIMLYILYIVYTDMKVRQLLSTVKQRLSCIEDFSKNSPLI